MRLIQDNSKFKEDDNLTINQYLFSLTYYEHNKLKNENYCNNLNYVYETMLDYWEIEEEIDNFFYVHLFDIINRFIIYDIMNVEFIIYQFFRKYFRTVLFNDTPMTKEINSSLNKYMFENLEKHIKEINSIFKNANKKIDINNLFASVIYYDFETPSTEIENVFKKFDPTFFISYGKLSKIYFKKISKKQLERLG